MGLENLRPFWGVNNFFGGQPAVDGVLLIFSPALKHLLPFVFAMVSSSQALQMATNGNEACTKQPATMSPVGTHDTLGIHMQCTIV